MKYNFKIDKKTIELISRKIKKDIAMKIKSFRIKNYRSIKDSGTCYLSGDNVTILAGQNESGKTSILEALEDFDSEKQIREEAVPLYVENVKPEIEITFELNNKELNKFIYEIDLTSSTIKNTEITIVKKYPDMYSISHDCIKKFGLQDLKIKEIQNLIMYFIDYTIVTNLPIKIINFPEIDNLNNEKLKQLNSAIIKNKEKLENELLDFPDELSNLIEMSDELLSNIEEYIKLIDDFVIENSVVEQWIPNFILFSSFDDIFPSEILLRESQNNEFIHDLSIISDLNLELINSGTPAAKTQHKEKLNIQLKADYKLYWNQDLTDLHIDWDSDRLYFFIKENDNFFPPNMRSKGKQWHLAFYVKISARSKEDVPNIILIDEPGLFLHAKAQVDILKKLKSSANNAPIIFSSHSPYLIEVDKLHRIRLISKTKENGTIISNKIHKDADKESLTPIITAIGLDLSIGLDIAKDNNIIVEGMSDYYYLYALKELLNFKFKHEVHFIPIQGADKFKFLIPLMIGWGLNYCAVLDNDAKGRKVETELRKNFGHTDLKTIFVSDIKDEEIEDLFNRKDFLKYILTENSEKILKDAKNSKIFKQKGNGFDKVLLSKLFYEKIKNEKISLSENTIENFNNLLINLDKIMFFEGDCRKSDIIE